MYINEQYSVHVPMQHTSTRSFQRAQNSIQSSASLLASRDDDERGQRREKQGELLSFWHASLALVWMVLGSKSIDFVSLHVPSGNGENGKRRGKERGKKRKQKEMDVELVESVVVCMQTSLAMSLCVHWEQWERTARPCLILVYHHHLIHKIGSRTFLLAPPSLFLQHT